MDLNIWGLKKYNKKKRINNKYLYKIDEIVQI